MHITHIFILTYWRRKWQPTPIFLPGKSHVQRSLSGLQSMGSQNQTQLNNGTTYSHKHIHPFVSLSYMAYNTKYFKFN